MGFGESRLRGDWENEEGNGSEEIYNLNEVQLQAGFDQMTLSL